MLIFKYISGTPSLPPSFRALTILKPSKPGFTNTYTSTLSLDQLPLLFSNAGSFEIHRGCIILVRPFLHSISLKKKKIYNLWNGVRIIRFLTKSTWQVTCLSFSTTSKVPSIDSWFSPNEPVTSELIFVWTR